MPKKTSTPASVAAPSAAETAPAAAAAVAAKVPRAAKASKAAAAVAVDRDAATTKEPKASKKKAAAVAPTDDAATAAAAAISPDAVATEAAVDAAIVSASHSTQFVARLQSLYTSMAAIKSEYRALEKLWSREIKAAQKGSSKRKRKAGNRAPSGFVKPTKISDELAAFLGKEPGSEMARTVVTKEINNYINTHQLKDSANGRQINPDAALRALLQLQEEDVLTYFNLQRYMKIHFAKADTKVEA